MSDFRLFSLFGVTRYSPQDVYNLRDRIFSRLVLELTRNGWNCDSASFGPGRRDTFLMEVARRGLPLTVTRLLEMGANTDYNTRGYGDSTALMAARDPEIMKKLIREEMTASWMSNLLNVVILKALSPVRERRVSRILWQWTEEGRA